MHRKLKITFNAPVTLGFVLICFIATLLGSISGGKITQKVFMTYHSSLTNPMTYFRFLRIYLGIQDGSALSEMHLICCCLGRC